MPENSHPYDHLKRRCPRLGGPVPFHYCRQEADNGAVCFKICDCWWERFDIVTYLKTWLSPEHVARLQYRPPPDKVNSLVDLIRQAQARSEKKTP